MTRRQFQHTSGQPVFSRLGRTIAVATSFTALLIAGTVISSSPGRADNGNGSDEGSKIQIGFSIAPVPLNLVGKDRALVGLGSYIVNAQVDCNGCHTANPATEYVGNPYLFNPPSLTVHQTKKVNPATYLGGGQDFGPYPAPNSPLHIFSRNLTPDITGKAEGDVFATEFNHDYANGQGLPV